MKPLRFVLPARLCLAVIGSGTWVQAATTSKLTATVQAEEVVHGMSRERLARIAPAMKEHIERNNLPGAVTLVARHGEVVHFETHGFLDAEKSKPVAKDTLFLLASMTKPIVSAAAMMLVEQGKISLNDPIATWLPELKSLTVETSAGDVPLTRPILILDLLRHTAGFTTATSKSPRLAKMYQDANIPPREVDLTGDEMLKRLGKIPLAHQPGTYWEYAIATDVLGLLLERVAQQPLDALLKELLLDPLGMADTTWSLGTDKLARFAGAPATLHRIYSTPTGRTYFRGGGGLIGTAPDYLRFAQMIGNGGNYEGRHYLSKKTIEFMLSDHTVGLDGLDSAPDPGYGFGLGFAVRRDKGMAWTAGSKGDAMWLGTFGTSFWIDPREGLVAIMMRYSTTRRPSGWVLFKNLVYAAVVE
jgi:CubicO group peptidase (beta-lactamase class C family)